MSKSDFTSTITTSRIHAYIVDKGQRTPREATFVFPGTLSMEDAEKAVEKAGKKAAFRLVYVDSVEVAEKLYALPIDIFTDNAKKLSRRGEDGRTREPLITRTLTSTRIFAVVVDKGQRTPREATFVFPDALSVEDAEKAVEKAGKKAAFRLVYVDSVQTENAVYEMPVVQFIALCEKHASGAI